MLKFLRSFIPEVVAIASCVSATFATDLTKIENAALLLGAPSITAIVHKFQANFKIVPRS